MRFAPRRRSSRHRPCVRARPEETGTWARHRRPPRRPAHPSWEDARALVRGQPKRFCSLGYKAATLARCQGNGGVWILQVTGLARSCDAGAQSFARNTVNPRGGFCCPGSTLSRDGTGWGLCSPCGRALTTLRLLEELGRHGPKDAASASAATVPPPQDTEGRRPQRSFPLFEIVTSGIGNAVLGLFPREKGKHVLSGVFKTYHCHTIKCIPRPHHHLNKVCFALFTQRPEVWGQGCHRNVGKGRSTYLGASR